MLKEVFFYLLLNLGRCSEESLLSFNIAVLDLSSQSVISDTEFAFISDPSDLARMVQESLGDDSLYAQTELAGQPRAQCSAPV